MTRTILFGILILILYSNACYAMGNKDTKEITFRSVTLTVVDAETKLPLEGVSINVVNTILYPKIHKLFFIHLQYEDIFTYYGYRYKTDSNGVVEIPRFVYNVKLDDLLYEQDIVINLEPTDPLFNIKEDADLLGAISLYTKSNDRFHRPFVNFKAGHIFSRPYPMSEENYYQREETKPYYTRMLNGHEIPDFTDAERRLEPRSFFCDHEDFTFYLERFTEVE